MHFDRLIHLIKRTGDRCIILNSEGEPEYVIIPFAQYEDIVSPHLRRFLASRRREKTKKEVQGLTERELLDKINRDIAVWKESIKDRETFQEWDTLMEHVQPEGPEGIAEENETEEFYEPEPLE